MPITAITEKQERPNVGYLTTLEHPDFGILGGYLVVDSQGRPLEFHCTAPVKPSRAQEILYGHSLRPYLLGEQIGGGLVRAAKLKPQVVVIDREDLGAFVASWSGKEKATLALLSDSAGGPEDATTVDIASHSISFPFATGEPTSALSILEMLSQSIDLAEPFQRIHLAIREAQRIGEDDQCDDGNADDFSAGSAHAA